MPLFKSQKPGTGGEAEIPNIDYDYVSGHDDETNCLNLIKPHLFM